MSPTGILTDVGKVSLNTCRGAPGLPPQVEVVPQRGVPRTQPPRDICPPSRPGLLALEEEVANTGSLVEPRKNKTPLVKPVSGETRPRFPRHPPSAGQGGVERPDEGATRLPAGERSFLRRVVVDGPWLVSDGSEWGEPLVLVLKVEDEKDKDAPPALAPEWDVGGRDTQEEERDKGPSV